MNSPRLRRRLLIVLAVVLFVLPASLMAENFSKQIAECGVEKGIVAIIDHTDIEPADLIETAKTGERIVMVQLADDQRVTQVRRLASEAGLLGTRLFVHHVDRNKVLLSDNLADAIIVTPSASKQISEAELTRALRPKGIAFHDQKKITKPVPEGADQWTHPYHKPDNNPQSNDRYVKGSFRTQFVGFPKFSPMPEQTVIGGGRIYKAMGHIAHKQNQNGMLNTLLCINAYNGTILWRRELPKGFMIHRNTMIATDDALLLGDHEACRIIDGNTGDIREELKVPSSLADGPVWKWMGISDDGLLIALIGSEEVKVDTQKSARRGLGHWPWGMWKGHDYRDPKTAFGFGRTFVAYDLKTKKMVWNTRHQSYFDARGLTMKNNRIYVYSPEKMLTCFNSLNGEQIWENSDKELLEAIGPNQRAQHYTTGYATTCYMKCSDDLILFAGPHRKRLVAASTKDGSLSWTYPVGNLQLVLRKDALYAAGPQGTNGVKLDYQTGKELSRFPARRACTRATGCADSIFFRASGGTVRVLTGSSQAQHIDPMRPPCQDGVLISNGHLYWGPWMCGCQLSLYGNICLAPVNSTFGKSAKVENAATETPSLIVHSDKQKIASLQADRADWLDYRGNPARSDVTNVSLPESPTLGWSANVTSGELPTAPVSAGGMVFVADRTGAVTGMDSSGQQQWKTFTGGPIYYPPVIAHDRLYVGSADGRVYAMEAKTGQLLWSHRIASEDRFISVYGKLISSWPVSGGVVVKDDKVYAAAGFTHYDGTHLVALDAISGKVLQENRTSGVLSREVNNGISMQGNLMLVENELRFLAGGVYETARYDLETLECLNQPKHDVFSRFRTAFYPYYPSYGKYLSLEHTCSDGSTLCHDASYEGNLFNNLALEAPLPEKAKRPYKEAARWIFRRNNQQQPKRIWKDAQNRRFTSYIISGDHLLAAGHTEEKREEFFLVAINIKTGKDIWKKALPALPVKGGLAIDAQSRIYASLENGKLIAFSKAKP